MATFSGLKEAKEVAARSLKEAQEATESVHELQARMRVLQAEIARYTTRESITWDLHKKDLRMVQYWEQRDQEEAEAERKEVMKAEPEAERTYKILGVWHGPGAYGMVCATVGIGRDRVGPMMTSNPSPQNTGGPEALARDIDTAIKAYALGPIG